MFHFIIFFIFSQALYTKSIFMYQKHRIFQSSVLQKAPAPIGQCFDKQIMTIFSVLPNNSHRYSFLCKPLYLTDCCKKYNAWFILFQDNFILIYINFQCIFFINIQISPQFDRQDNTAQLIIPMCQLFHKRFFKTRKPA